MYLMIRRWSDILDVFPFIPEISTLSHRSLGWPLGWWRAGRFLRRSKRNGDSSAYLKHSFLHRAAATYERSWWKRDSYSFTINERKYSDGELCSRCRQWTHRSMVLLSKYTESRLCAAKSSSATVVRNMQLLFLWERAYFAPLQSRN